MILAYITVFLIAKLALIGAASPLINELSFTLSAGRHRA